MYKLLLCAAVAGAVLCGPAEHAALADLLKGPYDYPSAIAFEGRVGAQVSLGGFTPGGFKITLDYTHRFANARDRQIGIWFFGDLNLSVLPGVGVCQDLALRYYECGALGYGSDFEISSGIQVSFRTGVPLVPYVRGGLAIGIVFGRDHCEDAGVGVPLALVGGGARYFFTRHMALSAAVDLHVGPAFYSAGQCFAGDHNELWRSLSFMLGAQYAL